MNRAPFKLNGGLIFNILEIIVFIFINQLNILKLKYIIIISHIVFLYFNNLT